MMNWRSKSQTRMVSKKTLDLREEQWIVLKE